MKHTEDIVWMWISYDCGGRFYTKGRGGHVDQSSISHIPTSLQTSISSDCGGRFYTEGRGGYVDQSSISHIPTSLQT